MLSEEIGMRGVGEGDCGLEGRCLGFGCFCASWCLLWDEIDVLVVCCVPHEHGCSMMLFIT